MSKQLACLKDLDEWGEKNLSNYQWQYIKYGEDEEDFDNRKAFKRLRLFPPIMRDVSTLDTSTTILGHHLPFPVCIGPTSFNHIFHKDGEVAVVKGADMMSIPYVVGMFTNRKMEEIAEKCPNLFKIFNIFPFKDKKGILHLIKTAEQNGFKAICLTLGQHAIGSGLQNNLTLPGPSSQQAAYELSCLESFEVFHRKVDKSASWGYVEWVVKNTHLPVIIKGMITGEDAKQAVQAKVAGILLSNHGHRMDISHPPTIDVLGEVVAAVAGRCEVFLDGGVRHGSDVIKALALGARAVFLGRPSVLALAFNGEDGVAQMLRMLKEEFKVAMELCGCAKVEEITSQLLRHHGCSSLKAML